jgi:hypothetical protein
MADDFAPPVKILLKAIETGIKSVKSIYESAGSSAAERAAQISDLAPVLIKSLEGSNQAIRDAYAQSVEACGEPFNKAVIEDSECFPSYMSVVFD